MTASCRPARSAPQASAPPIAAYIGALRGLLAQVDGGGLRVVDRAVSPAFAVDLLAGRPRPTLHQIEHGVEVSRDDEKTLERMVEVIDQNGEGSQKREAVP